MKLPTWTVCGGVLVCAALAAGPGRAANPGPMHSTSAQAGGGTTYCQFNSGPRAGTTVNLRGIPFAIGVACGDGNGSYGVSVPAPVR